MRLPNSSTWKNASKTQNRMINFINGKHSGNVVNLKKSLYSPVTIQYGAPSHSDDYRNAGPCPEVDDGGGVPAWRSHAQLGGGGSGGMLPREILNIYIKIIPFSAL